MKLKIKINRLKINKIKPGSWNDQRFLKIYKFLSKINSSKREMTQTTGLEIKKDPSLLTYGHQKYN